MPQLKALLARPPGRAQAASLALRRDAACVGLRWCLSPPSPLFGGANSPRRWSFSVAAQLPLCPLQLPHGPAEHGAAFALLTLGPALTPLGGPLLHLLLNLFCIGVLLLITADQPELGNASLYLFSYLFLYGNPVSGRSLALRGLEMLLGFALCAAVLYHNHRGRTPERPFRAVLRAFSLADEKCRWQLRVAVGISLAVLTGELLGLPRIMWVGFSCSSILTAYGSHPVRRAAGRVGGVLGGSLLFCLLYQLCPPALHGGLGILSGLCLGLCASYGFCTVFNCLGALLTASALFGPGPAAAIRVCNNVLGSLFGLFFALVWPWLLDALSRRRTAARES
ncbi:MAG: FUSC family protein [Flavonifractor plautii]